MEASSITYLIPGANIAPFLVLTRGSKPRVKEAKHFAQQLEACGTDVELLEVKGMNHREINRAIGKAGEKVVTPVVRHFINGLK